MKLFGFKLFAIVLSAVLFSACNGTGEAGDEAVSATAKSILPESTVGVIRGISLNASFSDVKTIETAAKLVSETPEKLEYELKSGEDEILLLYEFDPEGLYKINITAKSRNVKSAQDIEKDLIALMKAKYGEPKSEKGVTFWELPEKKLAIEVSQKLKSTELIIKYFEN